MFDTYPKTLSQIRAASGEDCFQLLTIDGDDFSQIKGLTEIGNKIKEKYPDMRLYISSNPHDFGTYYGLEVNDSDFEIWPDIECESLAIADQLGYDI